MATKVDEGNIIDTDISLSREVIEVEVSERASGEILQAFLCLLEKQWRCCVRGKSQPKLSKYKRAASFLLSI